MSTSVVIVKNVDFNKTFGSLLENAANDSIKTTSSFKVGLSGGSLVSLLKNILPSIKTDWSKWLFFFCDERVVSFDDPESTFGCYQEALTNIPISFEDQFIKIEPNLSASDAAVDYQKKLKKFFGGCEWPKFDLLLLGLGPDGHTCSLFPNHPLLNEKTLWVASITDSPKPPPSRITLTFPVINNAQTCLFSINGSQKANIVKKILRDKEDFPAGRVKPVSGQVIWLLDEDASSEYNTDS